MPPMRPMRRRVFLLRLALVVGTSVIAACQNPDLPAAPANAFGHRLFGLVIERLHLAREVAWVKFGSGAPVHDPVRETALLARIVAQAKETGVDPVRAETFFRAQIEASRLAQETFIAQWKSAPETRPTRPPRDLLTDLRPALDALTPRMIAALPDGPRPDLANAIQRSLVQEGFTPAVAKLAAAPLR